MGAGGRVEQSYSGLDQLNQKTLTVPGALSPFASWTNTYDPAGNRLSETVTLPTDPIAGPATFTYDTAQQLASAAFPTQVLASYGYDAAHNRNTVSGTPFGFLANNAISTEGPAGVGQIAYLPDADGNQTKDATGRVYKYDSLNRLEQVTDAAGNLLASYVYDARGRLVKRMHGLVAYFAGDGSVSIQAAVSRAAGAHSRRLGALRLLLGAGGEHASYWIRMLEERKKLNVADVK